jgi:hypothetical protein
MGWQSSGSLMRRHAMITLARTVLFGRYSVTVTVAVSASVCGVLFRYQPIDTMSPGVLTWWTALCAVSVFNIWMWRVSAAALARREAGAAPGIYRFQCRQLVLATVFVLGCAFRSMAPRADVQRIGLVDSWISSVLVGRSVATLAELCFAAQWALVLNVIARDSSSHLGAGISWLLIPLIFFAEICSWYGVLTTAYIGNVIEQSIWASCALLVVVSFAAMWRGSQCAYRPFLARTMFFGVVYVTFMCAVDIPMYTSRWVEDEALGREYLSLSEGIWDASSRCIVTHSWDKWHPEMPWMTLYFSVCVWCSIALVHFPNIALTEIPGERGGQDLKAGTRT